MLFEVVSRDTANNFRRVLFLVLKTMEEINSNQIFFCIFVNFVSIHYLKLKIHRNVRHLIIVCSNGGFIHKKSRSENLYVIMELILSPLINIPYSCLVSASTSKDCWKLDMKLFFGELITFITKLFISFCIYGDNGKFKQVFFPLSTKFHFVWNPINSFFKFK